MDTIRQINRLLDELDAAAIQLTDAQHPDVVVHLDLNCLTPGADGILECAIAESHPTATGLDVTLQPVRSHCPTCGTIFTPPPHTPTLLCPQCATI